MIFMMRGRSLLKVRIVVAFRSNRAGSGGPGGAGGLAPTAGNAARRGAVLARDVHGRGHVGLLGLLDGVLVRTVGPGYRGQYAGGYRRY